MTLHVRRREKSHGVVTSQSLAINPRCCSGNALFAQSTPSWTNPVSSFFIEHSKRSWPKCRMEILRLPGARWLFLTSSSWVIQNHPLKKEPAVILVGQIAWFSWLYTALNGWHSGHDPPVYEDPLIGRPVNSSHKESCAKWSKEAHLKSCGVDLQGIVPNSLMAFKIRRIPSAGLLPPFLLPAWCPWHEQCSMI